MKIKKLERDPWGSYDLSKIVDKINEIIDVLNNSFITHEENSLGDSVTDTWATISCDRLTPFTDKTTCEMSVDHLMNMVEGGKGIYDDIKCPKCGAKHFEVGPSISTCVYPLVQEDLLL